MFGFDSELPSPHQWELQKSLFDMQTATSKQRKLHQQQTVLAVSRLTLRQFEGSFLFNASCFFLG